MAAATDQGALIRIHACYTPPDVPAPPCVTSAATRLNVLLQSDLPAITSMPNAMLVRTGQTASLSATATGAPAPTLQWQTRAANATGAWTNVNTGTGGTTGNYTTPVLTTADNGTQFRVVASNAVGIAESAPVTVSVSDIDVAPTIGTQPASLSVAIGSDAAFAIAARGTEALSYQWQLNGTAITGANSPVLRLPAVSAPQGGSYTVVVSNAAGTVTSTAATLTVTAGTPNAVAPTIVTQPVAVAVNAGNTATFAAGVAGSGPFTYQWRKNGALITGATDAFYSIAAAVVGDAGAYSVAISSPAGNITSNAAALSVTPAAAVTAVAISTQPSPQVQIPGGSATFAVAASGSGPIGYQWLKNGTAMSGATAAVLTLNGLTGADAASYSVTVTGALGSVTSNAASLTVLGAPLIGTQPAAASAIEGASASFSVTASGTALGYQWTRNGVAIGGATAASYTTPALTLADNGAVYAVVVYNGAGVVISTGAALTVTSSAVTYPINVYVNYTATSSVVLQNNGGDTLTVNSDTTGHFATRIAAGAAFNVTVLTPPPGQTCTVVSGSGTAPQGPTTQINCARIPPVVAAAGMNKIAASPSQHTCAIKADGTVACWGNNSSREVTPLNGFNQDLPVVVPGLSNMVQVAVGNQNSCAIDNTGVVSCWGGSRTSIVKLKDGNGSDLTGATSLALGGYHGCLIDASSSVRCWGDNSVGQLGQGTMTGNAVTPVAVQRFGGTALTSVVSLAAGDFHTCALTFTGEVVCWGRGAIGDGSPVVDGLTYTGTQRALQAVTPAISAGANAITSGGNHSCAAMVAGGVKCWGFNLKSQLGDLGTTNQLLPVDVNDAAGLLTGVTLLAAQNNNTCAIPASGKVVCWGSVQPSSGAITYSPTVQGNMTQAVTALASGWNHSCILAADGSAECWGSNNNGQLGIGGTISVNTGGPFPGQGTSVIGGAVFWR